MTAEWIPAALAALLAWTALAVAVGIVIGRVVRNRDRQVPRDGDR